MVFPWQAVPLLDDVFRAECFSFDELSAIIKTEAQAGPYPWSLANFQSSLASGHLCLGVKHKSDWVAHAVFSGVIDELELLILSVSPFFKRRGLARSLLSEVIRQSEAHGFVKIHLEVRASNSPAIHLYEHLGFEQVGRRRDYYHMTQCDKAKEDALLFTRVKIPSNEALEKNAPL